MSDEQEIFRAERDAALRMVDDLERILTKIGGYMDPKDQDTIRHARAYLIERGVRKSDAPPVWADRVGSNGTHDDYCAKSHDHSKKCDCRIAGNRSRR